MSATAAVARILGGTLLWSFGVLSLSVARAEATEPASPAATAPAPTETGKPQPSGTLASGRDAASSGAGAAELPQLQPGLWEYRRTVLNAAAGKAPQASELKKCSNPTAEFRQKMTDLEKKGCQFSPTQRRQEGYVSNWTCVTPSGLVQFHDVLIVQSDTSYQDVIEARSGQQIVRSTIDAQRVGECGAADPRNLPRPRPDEPPFLRKPR